MRYLWVLVLGLVMATPAWAAGPYFWAAPSGTHNVTGSDAFCETIDSTDDSTDPGVYGTVVAAAHCKKTAGLGGIILKGSLGRYSGTNHRMKLATEGTSTMVSGTGESTRAYIKGAPGEAVPIIDLGEFYIQENNVGAQRDWTEISGLYLHGCSTSATPCTDTSGANAIINIYGDHNRIRNTECVDAWNACIIMGSYPTGSLFPEDNEVIANVASNFGRDGAGLLVYVEGDRALVQRNRCTSGKGACLQVHDAHTGLSADDPIVELNWSAGLTTITQSGFAAKTGCIFAIDGTNATIRRNVCDGRAGVADADAFGTGFDIGYNPGVALAHVYNNTIFGYKSHAADVGAFSGGSNSDFINNIMVESALTGGNQCSNQVRVNAGITGVTFSNNLCTGLISDVLTSYTSPMLKAGSAAIGAGTTASGITCNGTCDQGAFESFTYSSATINDVTLDVTLGMNLFTPVQNIVAAQWSVGCTGGANCGTPVVTNAVLKPGTSSVVRLTLSGLGGAGICETADQVWTVSATATAATDSALIGNSLNQPLTAFTTQAVTNACTGGGGSPPAGPRLHYKFEEPSGTSANDETANNLDGVHTGSPEVGATGYSGSAVHYQNDTTDRYTEAPEGTGVNPTTQSLTVAFWVKPDADALAGQKVAFSTVNGTNQRFYAGWRGGFWGLGIQSSGMGTASEFPVAAEWTRVCITANAATDTATLHINGVAGTDANAVKTYTSYTFADHYRWGNDGTNTINYGGATIDTPKVWLSVVSCADDYTAETPVTPTTGTFTQVAHQFQKLRQTSGGAIENYGAMNATMPVMVGGAFNLTTQTDCTTADCDPIAEKLHYSHNGGAFLPVPDFVSAGQVVYFYGTTDLDILTGPVTCCLTGALTATTGAVQSTSEAVPNFDLAQNASIVQRRVLRLGTGAVAGDTICFKEYNQTGAAFTSYTPTGGACVLVIGVAGALGF